MMDANTLAVDDWSRLVTISTLCGRRLNGSKADATLVVDQDKVEHIRIEV